MSDKLIRALGANEEFVVSALVSTEVVETARKLHNDSPVSISFLGELLTAGALIGDTLKGEKSLLTLELQGSGDLRKVTVTCDSHGNVKGFSSNPEAKEGIGRGDLILIKDEGLRTPYNSVTPLVEGNVALSLNSYYNQSAQLPTFFLLGVKLGGSKVAYSFGYMVQALPFAKAEILTRILENLGKNQDVEAIVQKEPTSEELIDSLLEGLSQKKTSEREVRFHCDCSYERGLDLLKQTGKQELNSMLKDGKPIHITCGFCGKSYDYPVEAIAKLLKD